MKFSVATSIGLALAGTAAASPLKLRAETSAADIIAEVAPNSKQCAETQECRTNVQVGPLLAEAMAKYGLMNSGQIAAVIALTALESVEYVYKHNVSPGRPGQGTSNMQMFSFNLQYAKSIPELKDALAGISGINEQNPDSTPDDAKKAVLALVQDDKYNFGSGPWYLSTMPQCDAAKKLLETSPDAGWAKYMTDCVGVDAGDAKRNEYWARAKKAFGLS